MILREVSNLKKKSYISYIYIYIYIFIDKKKEGKKKKSVKCHHPCAEYIKKNSEH